jgi:hypothetical protein
MFLISGCQRNESLTLKTDSYYEEQQFLTLDDGTYTVMLAEKKDRLSLLALKMVVDTFIVYRTYELPKVPMDTKIYSFSFDCQKKLQVQLIIQGKFETYESTRRVGFTGHYYAMDKYKGFNFGFDLNMVDDCFGWNNPCPFDYSRSRFISGPYVDYAIFDVHAISPQRQSMVRQTDMNWYTITNQETIYRVLAINNETLYQIMVQLADGEVVYSETKLAENVVYGKQVNSSKTIILIYNDSTYQFLYWDLNKSSLHEINGTYLNHYQYGTNYIIETSSHFYIFNEMLILHSIERTMDVQILSIYLSTDTFGYYYLEDNTIHYFHQSI